LRSISSKDLKRAGLGHLLGDSKPVKKAELDKVDSEYGAAGLRTKLKPGRTIIIKDGRFTNDTQQQRPEDLSEPGEDAEIETEENFNPEG